MRGRGKARRSLELIEASIEIPREIQLERVAITEEDCAALVAAYRRAVDERDVPAVEARPERRGR